MNSIHRFIFFFLLYSLFPLSGTVFHQDDWEKTPVAIQGRFCSLETFSKLWLYERYGRYELLQKHQSSPPLSSLEIVGQAHFQGPSSFSSLPLYRVEDPLILGRIELLEEGPYLSLKQLEQAIFLEEKTAAQFLWPLVHQTSSETSGSTMQLTDLAEGLWVRKTGNTLTILSSPSIPPWGFLKPGMSNTWDSNASSSKEKRSYTNSRALLQLLQQDRTLKNALIRALPSKEQRSHWLPLHPSSTSLYEKELSEEIAEASATLDREVRAGTATRAHARALSHLLQKGYDTLADSPIVEVQHKTLSFPSYAQLKLESYYYRLPLLYLTIGAYLLSSILLAIGSKRTLHRLGLFFFSLGLCLHTLLLALRIFILQRPPVANMFETLLYVPWIAALIGGVLYLRQKTPQLCLAASLSATALLLLIPFSSLDQRMQIVQPVLDSHYWLTIHVLLVVGSYGAFAIASVLGHGWLICNWMNKKRSLPILSHTLLQSLYCGTALLIAGTILGGVWAAQSWGRFWDWDPKEAWAFLSICLYLVWIHAYRFKRIHSFGLACGSVIGFLAISFTWYGVNYLLGTGLHSYGFGSGGEEIYLLFLGVEGAFLLTCLVEHYRKKMI